MSEIQGRQRTEERAKAPIIIPISALEPPWSVIKRGNRKKQPKLDTVKKLEKAMVRNDGLYNIDIPSGNWPVAWLYRILLAHLGEVGV